MGKNRSKTAKHFLVELYPEDGWDGEKIKKILDEHSIIKQYVYILHDKDTNSDGTVKKAHYYIYINFGRSSATCKDVARWFSIRETLVENVKSNKRKAVRYAIHLDQPEKYQYDKSEVISNFNLEPYFSDEKQKNAAQVERERKETIINLCSIGVIRPYNYEQFITPVEYAKYKTLIKRAWEVWDHNFLKENNGEFRRTIIWCSGIGGAGKSALAKLIARDQQKAIFISDAGNDPFDTYKGQPYVLLDDIMPNEPFSYHELLKLIDPNYISAIASRYDNVVPHAECVFVCTVLEPEAFYSGYGLGQNDGPEQLLRRIDEVWKFTKDHIKMYTHDGASDTAFVQKAIRVNPVPFFAATRKAVQGALDGVALLDPVIEKYVKYEDLIPGQKNEKDDQQPADNGQS